MWDFFVVARGVGGSVGEGWSSKEVDLFFKFTKRRAVNSTHANAQIAAKPASFRLGRPDTNDISQSRKISSQIQED